MAFELSGKVVLVTGASSGIGEAAVRAFCAEGCKVVAAARRLERLEQLAGELSARGETVLAVRCDVRSDEEVRGAFEMARERFGGVDILVNNAGLGLYGPVEDVAPSKLHENFETNVYGVLRCIRAAVPMMRARKGGQIINVSSVLGHRALPGMGGYCASKFALNGLTESLRVELAPAGIDVLLFSPGITKTEFRQNALSASNERESLPPFEAMSAAAVARELVAASRRRRRLTILTRAGRTMVAMNRFAPALFDRFAGRMVGPTAKGK